MALSAQPCHTAMGHAIIHRAAQPAVSPTDARVLAGAEQGGEGTAARQSRAHEPLLFGRRSSVVEQVFRKH